MITVDIARAYAMRRLFSFSRVSARADLSSSTPSSNALCRGFTASPSGNPRGHHGCWVMTLNITLTDTAFTVSPIRQVLAALRASMLCLA
jgi:hypothetical protein